MRDNIIRPILCLERSEIEAYLREKDIPYCQDATNEEDDYTRNRIRHHILPYAEKEIARGCVGHMAQTAAMLLETEEMLERLVQGARLRVVQEIKQETRSRVVQEIKPEAQSQVVQEIASAESHRAVQQDGQRSEAIYRIDCAQYAVLESVIGRRLIYQLLKDLSPGGRDIANVHVEDVDGLLRREGNRYLCLPYGIVAERQYGKVQLKRERDSKQLKSTNEPTANAENVDRALRPGKDPAGQQLPGYGTVVSLEELEEKSVEIPAADGTILHFQVISCKNCKDIPENRYTKWFDYDKIKRPLTVRTRNTGDFLSIRGGDGEQRHKSVKDYMVTEKISRQDRDRIPVIAEENHVLWLVGYRISEYYKINENTKRILQVQLRRGCKCSEMEEDNGRTC